MKKIISIVLVGLIFVGCFSVSVSAEIIEELEPINLTVISDSVKIRKISNNSINEQPINLSATIDLDSNVIKESTDVIVDKEYYDKIATTSKRDINVMLKNELLNKKRIIFYGNSNNLDLEYIAKILDCNYTLRDEPSVDPKTCVGCSVSYNENNVLTYSRYYNLSDDKGIEADLRFLSEDEENVIDEKTTENITTQKQVSVYNNDFTDPYENYTDTIKYDDMHFKITYGRRRLAVGSVATKWEIYQTAWISPRNENQTKYVKMWVRPYDWDGKHEGKRDEEIVSWLPKSSQATNTTGTSVSWGDTISTNIGTSITFGLSSTTTTAKSYTRSYPDINIKVGDDSYDTNSVRWEFLFKKDSNSAKGKSQVDTGALVINKKSDMAICIKSEFRTRCYKKDYWSGKTTLVDNPYQSWSNRMLWNDIK